MSPKSTEFRTAEFQYQDFCHLVLRTPEHRNLITRFRCYFFDISVLRYPIYTPNPEAQTLNPKPLSSTSPTLRLRRLRACQKERSLLARILQRCRVTQGVQSVEAYLSELRISDVRGILETPKGGPCPLDCNFFCCGSDVLSLG